MGECFYKSRVGGTSLSRKQKLEDIKKPTDILKTYKLKHEKNTIKEIGSN